MWKLLVETKRHKIKPWRQSCESHIRRVCWVSCIATQQRLCRAVDCLTSNTVMLRWCARRQSTLFAGNERLSLIEVTHVVVVQHEIKLVQKYLLESATKSWCWKGGSYIHNLITRSHSDLEAVKHLVWRPTVWASHFSWFVSACWRGHWYGVTD